MTIRYSTKPFGQRGEQLAAAFLRERHYEIVASNWRCKDGELDIIARQVNVLVFVEVRTRHADSPEPAFESITTRKRTKLIRLAHVYLEANDMSECQWRIDVIAIGIPRGGKPIIEHIEDALDW